MVRTVQSLILQQRRPSGSWVLFSIAMMMIGITILHYLTGGYLLRYHSIFRSLYYLPIAVAAVVWGVRGGLMTSFVTTAVYLPNVLFIKGLPPGEFADNVLEVVVFNVVAVLVGMLVDVQRRHRQRVEALQTYINDVLASLPVGVVTIEQDGSVNRQNPAATELLRGMEHVSQLPSTPGYYELVLGTRPVGLRCSPLHGTDGSTIGCVLVLEDMSEQFHLAEQVRQAEHLAALGQLASGLAHEVRNPLAIMRATAQLLTARLQDRADLQSHTHVLTTEADRIDRLLRELLAYAIPRQPQIECLDLQPFITDLAAAFAPYAEQHGVTLQVAVDDALPSFSGDHEQLRQALLNLLLNAVQASSSGGTVHLTCGATTDGLKLTVIDHGAGVPPAIQSRLFDPFFTTRDEGTGLGLSVVARIAVDHGGTVEVRNAPGGGTAAVLCFPHHKEVV